jgi:hypothetical protein
MRSQRLDTFAGRRKRKIACELAMIDRALELKAAKWIIEADGMLITAGAGMGIDSGLPDFGDRLVSGEHTLH